mgnify:CR=1 FL=1
MKRVDMDGFIDNQGNFGVDGIVGPHHEKEGSYDAYIGVYQPCDGRNRVLYTLPERNKVNSTDLCGPSSQAKWVNGSQTGRIVFRFME